MDKRVMAIKVRLKPSPEQIEEFHKNFGCVRKVYNLTLNEYNKLYEKDNSIKPTYTFLYNLMMKYKKSIPYLDKMESTSLQQSIRDLTNAFNNFFKNPAHNLPTFHRKKDKKFSFRQTIPPNKKIIEKNKISLRKYGKIPFQTSKEYRKLLNQPDLKINNITIKYDGIHYYAIININYDTLKHFELTGKKIGVDINSNKNGWIVTSDGVKEHFDVNHENKMIKYLNQLISPCRKKLSRKKKELLKRLQKQYNKRTNKLQDYIEKLSYNLVKKYDVIVFEKNYAKIKILIGGEQNLIFPLSKFINKLKKKFEWYKPEAEGVVFVDAKNTSKTCHKCGHINENLDVKTRDWICPKCGEKLDRDVNAAINILNRWNPGDCLESTQ
ncbi:RNA-guided endonuclease TnpB family protein [uncultured Methanobrevibacter sp.]|uniref:RNA-guided endonuclease InsQ/TnpB family protein n=1 Tax=uncultured Methanobrevibacter sp. TaxID=253161 RepID=UPI0025D6F010|nr:RNA-guided endonuclease TnpB family protein [uncultured Methanobrevibacter sp.]